jgi:Kef-type K+ transport system membrane component KefB
MATRDAALRALPLFFLAVGASLLLRWAFDGRVVAADVVWALILGAAIVAGSFYRERKGEDAARPIGIALLLGGGALVLLSLVVFLLAD